MLHRIRTRLPIRGKGPWILLSSLAVALVATPFAVAAGEGGPLDGGARNPSGDQRQEYTRETEIIANNATYGTRQSNKSNNGGGAIYGCRSVAGGTPKGNEPCVRANNLSTGRAFEFESNGTEVGRIESPNRNAAPFTTNAQGVATGLNADRVDSKSASDIVGDAAALNKFALVGANGTLGGRRGATASSRIAQGTYRVTFSGDISKCAPQATLAATDTANAALVGARILNATTVEVVAREPDVGTDAVHDAVDRPFSLTLTC
jgi:hypothetical protein